MEPSDLTGRSCSCTSIFYESMSDKPSLMSSINASRIDKLFLGKYIPLREQNLINKLVRTRAVYGDFRKQLLLDTNVKPNKHNSSKRGTKNHEKIDNNILVDKKTNKLAEQKLLSDFNLRPNQRLNTSSQLQMQEEHEFSKQRKSRGHRIGKRVRYKTKYIQSDPCTCVLKSGLVKRLSKHLLKKSRHRSLELSLGKVPRENETRRGRKFKQAYHKIESSMGEAVRKSITKVNRSKRKVEVLVKKSLQNVRNTNNRINETISKNFIKSIFKGRPIHGQELDTTFEEILDNEYKQVLEKWACEFECNPEECNSTECFELKKQRLPKERQEPHDSEIIIKKLDPSIASDKSTQVRHKNYDLYSKTRHQKTKLKDQNKSGTETRNHHKTVHIKVKSKNIMTGEKTNIGPHATTRKKPVQITSRLPSNSSRVSLQSLSKADKHRPLLESDEHQMTPKFKKRSKITKQKSIQLNSEIKNKKFKTISSSSSQMSVQYGGREIIKETMQRSSPTATHQTSLLNKNKDSKENDVKANHDNIPPKKRQAVKISSSFSFSIEFYKNKPEFNSIQSKRHKVRRKTRETMPVHPTRHKTSSTNPSRKINAKTGGYNLKRCVCTLKLKSKRTNSRTNNINQRNISVTKTMQTARLKKVASSPVLLPYECEPMICVSGECDPMECEKRIKLRSIKRHSVRTNTQYPTYRSQSTPNLKYRTVSTDIIKMEPFNETLVNSSRDRLLKENLELRQKVRIGSTFSFDVEFHKGDPPNREQHPIDSLYSPREHRPKLKSKATSGKKHIIMQNKAISQRKVHLTHKLSQISGSVKSASTLTKNNVQRCFCTLKLAKVGKKDKTSNNMSKKQKISKGTSTSVLNLPIFETKQNRAVDKITGKSNDSQYAIMLLPYECDPGVCTPGECNPHECQKIINVRNMKRAPKNTGTRHSPLKPTHSNTDKSVMTFNDNKKGVQQSVELKARAHKIMSPKKEKHKESTTGLVQHPQYLPPLKEIGTQRELDSKTFKSILAPITKKDVRELINSTIKRCLCILKSKTKPNKITNDKLMRPKSKIKRNKINLKPYECEPNFCIPGDCDPYQCLQAIKKRENIKSKDIGIITNTNKPMSSTRSTRSLGVLKSSNTNIQSNFRTEHIQKKKKRKRSTYTANDRSRTKLEIIQERPSRNAVQISSNMGFSIELGR